MIVTLTPNPSLDRTIAVESLTRGGVHRASSERIDPGGKGVNVSRALAANGSPTRAVLPGGGAMGLQFSGLLNDEGVAHDLIDLPGALRTNITVVEDDGTTTKINEPGRVSTEADAALMVDTVASHLDGATWVVGCGSLPPGLPDSTYVALVQRARTRGVTVAIDTSGNALRAILASPPDLIKPNHHELAELVEHDLTTFGDVTAAAKDVLAMGVATVVVSLGSQGAVAVTDDGIEHAIAPVSNPLSTVGAGDCLLAGWLHAVSTGANPREAIALAVRWGSAAVSLPGSRVPGPADVGAISTAATSGLADDLLMPTD